MCLRHSRDARVHRAHAHTHACARRLRLRLRTRTQVHHVRELGFSHPILDYIDERRLEVSELLTFLKIIFGSAAEALPDPRSDYDGFEALLREMAADAGPLPAFSDKTLTDLCKGKDLDLVHAPVMCADADWINWKHLKRFYQPRSSACTVS
jgi:hypothetical protein